MLAIGIVLTFRASNVINLAHAAMGMYIAYVYFGLRNFDLRSAETGGDLVLPIIGLPTSVHIVDRPTVATAFVIAMVVATLLGLVVYGLVFRPLRQAPPLARIVASLGVFLYLQSVMQLRVTASGAGSASLRLTSLLPDGVVHIGDAVVPTASFVLAGLAIAVAVGLGAVFRYTRFGLATRAAAEHEKGALLTGLSPDRLGYLNWAIASVLAGAAVIAVAGVSSKLDPIETSLLVVPALAAALLGGLNGFAVTTVAGLAIGMSQSVLSTFQARTDWLPEFLPNGGLRDALPVLLILVAITMRGSHLPSRESILDTRLPASPTPRHVLGLGGGTLGRGTDRPAHPRGAVAAGDRRLDHRDPDRALDRCAHRVRRPDLARPICVRGALGVRHRAPGRRRAGLPVGTAGRGHVHRRRRDPRRHSRGARPGHGARRSRRSAPPSPSRPSSSTRRPSSGSRASPAPGSSASTSGSWRRVTPTSGPRSASSRSSCWWSA